MDTLKAGECHCFIRTTFRIPKEATANGSVNNMRNVERSCRHPCRPGGLTVRKGPWLQRTNAHYFPSAADAADAAAAASGKADSDVTKEKMQLSRSDAARKKSLKERGRVT